MSTFCFIAIELGRSFRKFESFLISHFQGFNGETYSWYACNASLIFEVGAWPFWSGDVISPNGYVFSRLLSRHLMLLEIDSLCKISWTLPMEVSLNELGKET